MKLLIFGATGATGQELVKQSLEAGHQVTAFVRTPSRLTFQHQDMTVFEGDVIDAALVRSAVEGKNVVLSTLGASSPFKFDQNVVDGIGNIVEAMEGQGVKRLIYLSAMNVKESRHDAGFLIRVLAPLLLRHEIAGHEAKEQIIKQSQLDWTIVRAAGLTNGALKTQYRSGEDIRANGPAASISRADVAHFMLKQVSDRTYLHRAVRIMY